MENGTTNKEEMAGILALQNVVLLAELINRVMNRDKRLPGLAVFFGYSGYGKTFGVNYGQNKFKAYTVQVKSVWSKKRFLEAILRQMGYDNFKGTISDMVDAIATQLNVSNRPLLIDEADLLIKPKGSSMIEMVRDIYESCNGTIILVGEENLPKKLREYERIHGRLLDQVAAQPANENDIKQLTKLYCKGIEISDGLIKKINETSKHSVRRICVNLEKIREFAEINNLTIVDSYSGEFSTGEAPTRKAL